MTNEGQPGDRFRRTLLPLTASTLCTAAWIALVLVAVEFGKRGRDGDAVAWVFLTLAALGAATCLVLALIFGRQLLAAVGAISDYEPKRARRSRPPERA